MGRGGEERRGTRRLGVPGGISPALPKVPPSTIATTGERTATDCVLNRQWRRAEASKAAHRPAPSRPSSAKASSSRSMDPAGGVAARPGTAVLSRKGSQRQRGGVTETSGSFNRLLQTRKDETLGGWEVDSSGTTPALETSFEVTGWSGGGAGEAYDAGPPSHHPRAFAAPAAAERDREEQHAEAGGGSKPPPARKAAQRPVPELNVADDALGKAGERGGRGSHRSPGATHDEHWYRRHGWETVRARRFLSPFDVASFAPRPASAGVMRWDAKDWLWNADRDCKAPIIRYKAGLCTVSPAAEVYNRFPPSALLRLRHVPRGCIGILRGHSSTRGDDMAFHAAQISMQY